MSSKVFSIKIFKNHYSTFTNEDGDAELVDWLLMLGVPSSLALILAMGSVDISGNTVVGILTLGAILTGLLLNLLVLVYDQKTKHKDKEVPGDDQNRKSWQRRYSVIEEVHFNIGYAIWISLLGMFLGIAATFNPQGSFAIPLVELDVEIFTWLISFPLYFVFSHLLLTIYMILKRVYELVTD